MKREIQSESGGPLEDNDELLTEEEVHKIVKLSRTHLRQLRMRGEGPHFYRLGRAIRYSRKKLIAWIQSRGR